jgi:hypothetical protein
MTNATLHAFEHVLYARREPTTDTLLRERVAGLLSKHSLPKDTVFYRDNLGKDFVARSSWDKPPPDRHNKYVMHNCARYRLVWLPPLAA